VAVKNYVLDTNVMLHDARAIYAFADNNVVIPIYVIEEVDTFKKDQSELGRNARQIARLLDEHRSGVGGLSQPQKLPQGGTIRVALAKNPVKNPSYDSRSMDQRILENALEVRDEDHKEPTNPVPKGGKTTVAERDLDRRALPGKPGAARPDGDDRRVLREQRGRSRRAGPPCERVPHSQGRERQERAHALGQGERQGRSRAQAA